jgi:hypothetical protein
MSIVRTGLRGRRGLGRLRGRRLGQDDGGYTDFDLTPGESAAINSPTYGLITPSMAASTPGFYAPSNPSDFSPSSNNTYGYGTSAVPGSISPQDAALLSTAITTAGKVGTQAIIGTPTLTYNPETGQYTATGGATIPTSTALFSSIESYLPLILLGVGVYLVFTMGRR